MLSLPPQTAPVIRDPKASPGLHDTAVLRPGESVEASQSRCSHLTGPAQSLCYAALYGVSV